MFKVIVDFKELSFNEIDGDDPEKVAQNVKSLISEGKIKPEFNEISVFNPEDELGFEPPIYTLKFASL